MVMGSGCGDVYTPTRVAFKLVFITCVVLQVVIWPSAASITFACAFALGELYSLAIGIPKGGVWAALAQPGVFVFGSAAKTGAQYAAMAFMGAYFLAFFGLFVVHETGVQPAETMWLTPGLVGNYTMSAAGAAPLPVDVQSDASREMRRHPFVWRKHFHGPAPVVVGTVAGAGPQGQRLSCLLPGADPTTNASFACYIKLLQETPPGEAGYAAHPYVPLAEPFYHTDVRITPPAGVACGAVEAYRIVLDKDQNVVYGLDYPGAVIQQGHAPRGFLYQATCGIFNTPNWCLQMSHTFTDAQYRREIARRCAENDGHLVFRLPSRAPDIDYAAGAVSADILLVTAGATVQLHAGWKEQGDDWSSQWFWAPFRQVVHSDGAQGMRESSEGGEVFLKMAVAVVPLLVTWYYLAVDFEAYFPRSQVMFLCIFVLTPAGALFLSIGAYIPMAGCVVCVIAVCHEVRPDSLYHKLARPALLFLTAVCNSIQFGWMIAMIVKSGYSAFYYEVTLQQLYDLSFHAIVSGTASPTWVALMLPTVLLINGLLLFGSAICVVLESMSCVWTRP